MSLVEGVMGEQGICAHEGCHCRVPAERAQRGETFCSDYCAKHGAHEQHTAHDCGCGHGACAA